MNKELKVAIDSVICSTVCGSLDIPDLDWGVKRKLHEGIQEIIEKYLQEGSEAVKPSEPFTARDARSAVCKARTCEGFIQNILEDIKYKAECGITETRIVTYVGDYKHCYLIKLYAELHKLQFDFVETHKAVAGRMRVQTIISW